MRYVMKEKLLCLGDDYRIQDAQGRNVFYVDGKVLSIRDTLIFQDLQGNELATIVKRILSWGPTYDITRDGKVVAVVKKKLFTFFRCKFTVDVPGPDDYEAAGNFLDREYTFTRGDRLVAHVSKKWFSFADAYGVDVVDGEDDILILACAVVIDQICHDKDHRD
jgi:uncharacterized protein YxjI